MLIHTNTHRKWIILMGLLGNDMVGEGRGKGWWVGILLHYFYFFYEKGLAESPLAWSWLWWRCFHTAWWRHNSRTISCIYINMHINAHLEHTTGKSSDIHIQLWSPHYSQDKEHIHHPQKLPLAPSETSQAHPIPIPRQTLIRLQSLSLVLRHQEILHFPEFYIHGTMQDACVLCSVTAEHHLSRLEAWLHIANPPRGKELVSRVCLSWATVF